MLSLRSALRFQDLLRRMKFPLWLRIDLRAAAA
jgi:hypothetical protein